MSLLQLEHKSENSALCLPQKPEIQTESNQWRVCTAGVHIMDLVLPTSTPETAAHSLPRRISSPRMTLKQTTVFCY